MASDIAKEYFFVREVNNRSEWVDFFNEVAGAPKGSFWCMSFVVTMVWIETAERETGRIITPKTVMQEYRKIGWNLKSYPIKRIASVSKQLIHAKRLGSGIMVLKPQTAQKNDIFIQLKGNPRYAQALNLTGHISGHTGEINNNTGALLETSEGNGNSSGSRNGDRALSRKRSYGSISCVLRYLR